MRIGSCHEITAQDPFNFLFSRFLVGSALISDRSKRCAPDTSSGCRKEKSPQRYRFSEKRPSRIYGTKRTNAIADSAIRPGTHRGGLCSGAQFLWRSAFSYQRL